MLAELLREFRDRRREVDGRILARAVSFKGAARRDDASETDIVAYEPVADRIDFTADLASAWARLRQTKPADRRVALVLANYPNRDGRIGNGVGLDTPAGVVSALNAMIEAGYSVKDLRDAGYTDAEELRTAGCTVAELRDMCKVGF